MASVPWDSSYNYVVNFDKDDLIEYIKDGGTGKPAGLSNVGTTYIRPGQPVTIDAPWSKVRKYNFCMVHNPQQPVEGSEDDYRFYFITDSAYASPASTVLSLQVDVWSTYMVFRSNTTTFGHCFYEEIAYRQDQGDENIDIARRYCSISQPVAPSAYTTFIIDDVDIFRDGYAYALNSSIRYDGDVGTVENPAIFTTAGEVNGNNYYGTFFVVPASTRDLQNLLLALMFTPWITQGFLSLVCLPRILFGDVNETPLTVKGAEITTLHTYINTANGTTVYVNGINQYVRQWYEDAGVPEYLVPMFFHSPNTVIELTNFTGSSVMLQPELIYMEPYGGAKALVMPLDIRGSYFPGDEKVFVTPTGYGGTAHGGESKSNFYEYETTTVNVSGKDDKPRREDIEIPDGESFDVSLVFRNFPSSPMCSDTRNMYAATHANQIQWSYDSASWVKSSAKMSASNARNISRAQMDTNAQNQAIQNQLTDKQQLYSAVGSAISTVGNLASLNIGGAISSAANGVLGYLNTEAAQNASNAQFANNQALLGYTADQNYALANAVANGNYQNTIAGIAATNADAELTPPSVAGQFGGAGSNQQLGLMHVFCRAKTCSPADVRIMTEYFMRYGIEVHEWVLFAPYMLCNMTEFAYHKIPDMSIKNSAANDTEINALKGIFARGVTVCADPSVINYLDITRNDVRWRGHAYLG